MAPAASRYSTKELTKETLPDFEELFEKHPAPGAFLCWCLYHHGIRYWPVKPGPRSRARQAGRNRRQKRELVESGRSHGVLVYSNGEPVGWCQFGPWEELPRFENRLSRLRPAPGDDKEKLWRITCFVVDARYRQRGVATAALKAALEAIRKKGGGLVEAYPMRRWGPYREYLGIVSMFNKAGFETVAPFGKDNVVMRRTI